MCKTLAKPSSHYSPVRPQKSHLSRRPLFLYLTSGQDAAGQTATGLHAPPLLQGTPVHEAPLALPAAPEGEDIVFDYAATGVSSFSVQ